MYTSVNSYLKKEYGRKIYKLAINAGLSCPNRDGTLGTGGCIFCSGMGSGDFAESSCLSITDQINLGKARVSGKMPANGAVATSLPDYIAYFQAFTNTYGPIDRLRSMYLEAANHPDIAIISIATRPDCLSEEVLQLLAEINEIKPVWVELGLQTIHEATANYIRRGYPLSVYNEAVKQLNRIGTKVITHVILGLPGETREMMLETVAHVVDSHSWGIKLQLLHVLKNTDLAADYLAGRFNVLEMDEYIDIVKSCVDIIPTEMVIHRITGDGDKKSLIAPLWSADKKRVLNALNKALLQ